MSVAPAYKVDRGSLHVVGGYCLSPEASQQRLLCCGAAEDRLFAVSIFSVYGRRPVLLFFFSLLKLFIKICCTSSASRCRSRQLEASFSAAFVYDSSKFLSCHCYESSLPLFRPIGHAQRYYLRFVIVFLRFSLFIQQNAKIK